MDASTLGDSVGPERDSLDVHSRGGLLSRPRGRWTAPEHYGVFGSTAARQQIRSAAPNRALAISCKKMAVVPHGLVGGFAVVK